MRKVNSNSSCFESVMLMLSITSSTLTLPARLPLPTPSATAPTPSATSLPPRASSASSSRSGTPAAAASQTVFFPTCGRQLTGAVSAALSFSASSASSTVQSPPLAHPVAPRFPARPRAHVRRKDSGCWRSSATDSASRCPRLGSSTTITFGGGSRAAAALRAGRVAVTHSTAVEPVPTDSCGNRSFGAPARFGCRCWAQCVDPCGNSSGNSEGNSCEDSKVDS